MVRRNKKRYTKKNLAAAVLLSCLLSSNQVLGAELATVVPSDFHNSQLGSLSGSRVTAYIDPASAGMKTISTGTPPYLPLTTMGKAWCCCGSIPTAQPS